MLWRMSVFNGRRMQADEAAFQARESLSGIVDSNPAVVISVSAIKDNECTVFVNVLMAKYVINMS